MEERKPVSVFKSICWCVVIFILSYIVVAVLALIWGFIIGWLTSHVGFIDKILSYKIVYFIFMTATCADIGRRAGGLLMKIFTTPMTKSASVGKGFLGAGIILIIICVLGNILTFVANKTLIFLDLGSAAMGLSYIFFGMISEDKEQL